MIVMMMMMMVTGQRSMSTGNRIGCREHLFLHIPPVRLRSGGDTSLGKGGEGERSRGYIYYGIRIRQQLTVDYYYSCCFVIRSAMYSRYMCMMLGTSTLCRLLFSYFDFFRFSSSVCLTNSTRAIKHGTARHYH